MRRHLLALTLMFCGLLFNAQIIYNGQNIQQDKRYWSDNGQYYLLFQKDGNLVLYNRSARPLWESKTTNRGTQAIFQSDGNLVVYAPGNRPIFSSNTNGKRATKLSVQNDGNLVIYNRSSPVWASNTSNDDSNNNGGGNGWGFRGGGVNPGFVFYKNSKIYSANRNYYLVFQNDGNLVFSRNNGEAIWASGTDNKGSRAEFQQDGNLVVYDSYNKAVWSSNTQNRGATRLAVQDDGNLVVYQNSTPLWSSER
jgi:exopolysaccharide biosynthesis protein